MVPRIKQQYEEEATEISRSFSWEVAELLPGNEIAQAMPLASAADIEEERGLDWQTFMRLGEAQDTSEELKVATKLMIEAWRKLSDALPSKDKKSKNAPIEWPSMSLTSKNEEETETQSKMIKVKSGFQKLCSVADRYSGLFSVVPSGNEYVSVIVGVVKTIVTATVTHKTIGDGFHTAIDKIGEELRFCADELKIWDGLPKSECERLQTLVARFFVQVFDFLIPYSKWCCSKWRRIGFSLDKDYYKREVEGPLANIMAKSLAVERQSNMQMARTMVDVQGKIYELVEVKDWMRQELQDTKYHLADMMNSMRQLRQELGREGNLFTKVSAEQELRRRDLKRIEEVQQNPQKKQRIDNLWTSALKSTVPSLRATSISKLNTLRWTDIELASRHLEITSENGYPLTDFATLEDINMVASSEIFESLQELMMAEYSQTLWLCSAQRSKDTSEVSMAASYLLMVSERLKIPSIAYRFRVEEFGISEDVSDPSEDMRSEQMNRMTMMIYSLIRQLIWLLPDEVESTSEFDFNRFYQLDGKTSSLPDAFNIVEELLALMPPLLICVFDGFELVDNDFDCKGTAAYLDLFFEILRKVGQDKVIKVLISSAGPCITLLSEENVKLHEQVHFTNRGDSGPYFSEVMG